MSEDEKNPETEQKSLSPVVPVEQQDEDGVDLRDIVNVIVAGKWKILVVTVIVTALATAYAFLWPPVYEADTMIQINQFPMGATGASSAAQSTLIAPFLPTGSIASAEVEIMTSRSVLLPVIRKKHLNILINKPIPIIGQLFKPSKPPPLTVERMNVPDTWKDTNLTLRADGGKNYTLFSPDGQAVIHGEVGKEASALKGRVRILVSMLDAKAGRTFDVMRLYDSEAVYYLQKELTATEMSSSESTSGFGSETGVVQLELEGKNPYVIRNIVNALSDQYIKENISAMAEQAKKSLEFVNAQLPVVNQKFITAEQKLTDYEQKYGVVNIDVQTQATLQQIATYEGQLTQLELVRIGIAQLYTSNFPGYASVVNQERQIQHKIDALNQQLRLLPKQEQGYVELERDTTVYGQLYQQLLATQQDLAVTEAGTIGSARIVDRALTPYEPIWPIIWLVIVIGVLVGLIFGTVYVFLRSALARGVLDATELERDFGLPVYSIIPHSAQQHKMLKKAEKKKKRQSRIPLLAQIEPGDPAIEAMRSLRMSLNFALWESERKILTFSGASAGVGKSFLSANAAHVLAAADQKILVIDADMRKGHLHRYFGVPQQPGLSEVLSGQRSLEDVLKQDPLKNGVDFIPAGTYPPGVFELVSGPRLVPMLDECAANYDVIIVDVPPVLAVAEGVVIARCATGNFLVVKAGGQTSREIHLALERMRQNGVKVMGFVFNDLTQRAVSATFGRYASAEYYGTQYYGDKPTNA